MNTESVLKWGVILVLGYVALRWFTSLLGNVVDTGASPEYSYGSSYGVPYMPGGYVGYAPEVTAWSPDHYRGSGPRWTYGGFSPDEGGYSGSASSFQWGGGVNGPGWGFSFGE